jgi:hypothetical protein
MGLSEKDRAFVERYDAAAMITVGKDGFAKPARVGIALVEGKLWSSGTVDRVRTKRLRRDPRCTLLVFAGQYEYLSLETNVTILDGPDAAERNLELFRVMQKRPTGPLSWFGGEFEEPDFLQKMRDEQRVIYEFDVVASHGMG